MTTISQPSQSSDGRRKFLFVASTGGHLAQLVRLSANLDASVDSQWITFKTEQSVSLLEGRRVVYVPYVRSRDYLGVIRTLRLARDVFRREHFDEVVSTGAALALGVFPNARLARIPTTYVESVSRVKGPSMTGRIVARLRLARTFTQHPSWSNSSWKVHPSVLSQFDREEKPSPVDSDAPLKIFVTLGTIRPYRFDSLVDAMLATGLTGDNTTWQLGETDRPTVPGAETQITAQEFERYSREADVVVTHAGVGTILGLLEMGIYPVIVPRRKSRGEHVDDHQEQIANLVKTLHVGEVCEVDELTSETLRRAARYRVVSGVRS
ncbi:hypothetical protein B7R54_03165 [Subtercola boreus]|uniref:Glycosyl transferase family 28 C-terminal domain-containing protein n=1 Tax=Subtercola boreus TaxID=120213 RepID=A0A3E0VFA9_9MICO|nr:glycosyltransferase [Subtercola boreus]RFA08335.1 hypothetical protein B7R54_03165 [Subtercola boreus]TQL54761.1 UDP-N-acetylglucosamine:LPS N-acetylglucosamine transferase [Subtercola boreus]